MSLELIPFPTASGMEAALDYAPGGLALQGKFIGVGTGKQEIILDDAGRAITNRLKTPVAWLEILSAERVNEYQWQLTVDVAGTNNGQEYNLAEIALSTADEAEDANNHVIAIYGNATQALMTISPQVDTALIAINLLLATFPANSVEIVHQNLPLDLSVAEEMAAIMLSVGTMSLSMLESAQTEAALKAENQAQQQQLDGQAAELMTLNGWKLNVDQFIQQQQLFNAEVHRSFGDVSQALLEQ